jgi:predicted transcriptional regulator
MTASPFSLRLSPELEQRLATVAARENRSAADLATRAIESYLNARETKDEAIRAAFLEADKGIFVSQEAVHRWMESWDTDDELPMPEPDIFPEDTRR